MTIARLEAGRIIGDSRDDGLTTHSENWIFSFVNNTEILWFSQELFDQMWRLQANNASAFILTQAVA
jgi:hypothetical protein